MEKKQEAIGNADFLQALTIMSEFQHFMFELSNHLGGTALEPEDSESEVQPSSETIPMK